MNLEKFPSSKSGNRMLSYLTEGFYDRSYIGKWIFEVMGQEWDEMIEIFDTFQEQCFPKTCTWSLQYFEQMFGLESKGNFEERKIALLEKISVVLPFNQRNIKKSIQEISNVISEKIQVIEYPEEFSFEVKILADDEMQTDWKLIQEYLDKIKPAHLLLLFVVVSICFFNAKCFVENNILQVRSGFYMLKHLLLNGDWYVDGEYNLSSEECLECILSIWQNIKCEINMDFASTINSTVLTEIEYGFFSCLLYDIENSVGLQETLYIKDELYINSAMETKLQIEKDLWYLDGTMQLDGTKLLDAEIQEITL